MLNGSQLVYAAEYRLGLGGDEPLADAERVYAGTLHEQVAYQILIERIGRHHLHVLKTGGIEHFAGLDRKVSDIAGIQTDAACADALLPLPVLWQRGLRLAHRT